MAENKEIIKNLYTHFAERDLHAIKAVFDDDIIWEQMEGFPGGGQYKGFDDIADNVFGGFRKNWTDWKAVVEEFIEADNSVFAIGYYSGTFNETGRSLKASFIHLYKMANGKITRFTQYTDTLLVAEAMGL